VKNRPVEAYNESVKIFYLNCGSDSSQADAVSIAMNLLTSAGML